MDEVELCFPLLRVCGVGTKRVSKYSKKTRGPLKDSLVCFTSLVMISLMITIIALAIQPTINKKSKNLDDTLSESDGSNDDSESGGNSPTQAVQAPSPTSTTGGSSQGGPSPGTTEPSTLNAPIGANSECTWDDRALPRWVSPKEYSITIDVDIESLQELVGVVEILMDVMTDTNCIIIKSASAITISTVKVKDNDEEGEVSIINKNMQFAIRFPSLLPSPEATIIIEYNLGYGNNFLSDVGALSINKNEDIGDQTSTEFFSHFQEFGAFNILPSFDEYDMPAIHKMSIIVVGDYVALSNMKPSSTTSMEGRKTKHEFSATPQMPTSLLAFSIGEFSKISKTIRLRDGQVDVRFWGYEGISSMKETMTYVEKIMQEFEIKLNQAYTLPKIDFVSTPNTLVGSGSLGLFYINDNSLYKGFEDVSAPQLSQITNDLGYATSKFWFGNLVQTNDQANNFLKDSFATYFQYIGVEASLSGHQWFHRFYVQNSFAAIAIDDGEGPPPVVVEDDSFQSNLILRNKGASLIRMLRTFYLRASEADNRILGSDVVMNGLQDYMRNYKMTIADRNDLWRVLRETSGDDIDVWMDHWTKTPGVPIVHIIKEGNDVYVKQSPLLTPKCDDAKSMWIPIQYKTKLNPTPRWKILQKCGPEIMVTLESSDDSAIVNVGGVGYYRAHYHWDILDSWRTTPSNPSSVLDSTLNSLDLAVFLSDTLGCNEVGKYTINIFLDFASALALRQDIEYSPWKVAIENFGKIRNLIQVSDNTCAQKLSLHVREQMISPMLSLIKDNQVGDNDTLDMRLLRSLLLNAAMEFGDTSRLSDATSSIDSISNVHLDLRNSLFRGAIRVGGANMFENIMEKGKAMSDNNERKRLFTSLVYSQDKILLSRMWDFAMRNEYLGIHDVLETIRESKGAPNSIIFQIVLETYVDLKNKRGVIIYDVVSDLFLELSRSITNESLATSLKTLSDAHVELQSVAREVSRVISRNNEWVLKNLEPLCDWLDSA